MAFVHGKTTSVLVGGYDLTTYLREASVSTDVDVADTSVFGNTYKTGIVGLGGSSMNFSGLYESSASAIDATLSTALAASGGTIVTIGFDSSLAIGKRIFTLDANETSYAVNGSISDVVSVQAAFSARTNLGGKSGVSLHALAAETSSTNSASVDNGAATTNGGWGSLHVTVANRADADETYDIKIQHSTNDSTWADLITFTQVAASTPQAQNTIVASGTTVNRYLRVVSTIAGTTPSITFHANFVRG